MKQLTNGTTMKGFFTFLMLCLVQAVVWAQNEGSGGSGGGTVTEKTSSTKVDITTSAGANDWYTQPWVWIVGAAVLILLLVALLRGGGGGDRTTASRTDKVTVTKSTSTDTDI